MTAHAERLTREEVRDIVSRTSYKPGTKLVFHEDVQGHDHVMLSGSMPTSRAGHHVDKVTFSIMQPVPYASMIDQAALLAWIEKAIIVYFEEHERQEWFALDGKLIRSPHGEEPGTVQVVDPRTLHLHVQRVRVPEPTNIRSFLTEATAGRYPDEMVGA